MPELRALLILFWFLLQTPTKYTVSAFYIMVEVYSILVVEQCWCVFNSVYSMAQGRRWYGILGERRAGRRPPRQRYVLDAHVARSPRD